jgi:hypothetical protein
LLSRLAVFTAATLMTIAGLPASVLATDGSWNQTTGGTYDWNNAANWSGGVPNGIGSTATLTSDITSSTTVTNTNQTITLGTLVIGGNPTSASAYIITSSSSGSYVF